MTRSVALVLAALVVAAVAACGSDGDSGDPQAMTPPTADASPGMEADFKSLCVALDAALVDDIEGARNAFDHGPLHELADAAIRVDRGVAAHLLEAKQAVESDLDDTPATADQVRADLQALVEATEAAMVVVGEPTPRICEQESE